MALGRLHKTFNSGSYPHLKGTQVDYTGELKRIIVLEHHNQGKGVGTQSVPRNIEKVSIPQGTAVYLLQELSLLCLI